MATITIAEQGCRGCTLCVDHCPVDVFEYDEAKQLAEVARAEDCIGCLTCHYECPSQCVEVADVPLLRPFHRVGENAALVQRFLQAREATSSLTRDDWEEARLDVAARLLALAATVHETLGRGNRAVGRRAGALAAAHMPEMYDAAGLEKILVGLQARFRHAFEFDFVTTGGVASLTFNPCGLCQVVESAGETVGEAVLCQLFHEFLAGLLSAFVGSTYRYEVPKVGKVCRMELMPSA